MVSRNKKDPHDLRTNFVVLCFAFGFLLVVLKLFQIQVIDHSKYSLAAQQQHWGQYTLPAIRGDIYSSDNFLLAGTQDFYLLFVEPQKITDKKQFATELADYFSKIKYKQLLQNAPDTKQTEQQVKENLVDLYSKAISQDLLWVAIEHAVTPEQRDELTKQNLAGVGFEPEPARFYPEKTMASNLLGFVASDAKGEKQGYFGIEGAFNEDLRGRVGKLSEEVDPSGTPILIGGSKKTDAIQGSTIFLTINRSVQHIVEQKLRTGVEKYEAKSGSVIIMDPATGNVIAMANYPTYDPAFFNDEDLSTDPNQYRKTIERRNLAIAETYEPGSIMKPLTISTAIDLGLINPDTTFEDSGPVNYSGHLIDTWDSKHYGTQTIIQLLQKSNNIGAAWVGTKVGSASIYKYFSNFGLGAVTKIDLEGEDTGIMRPFKTWTDIDLANISFGQGISATPLQMVTAFNVFSNGGILLQPRIVDRIVENGKTINMPIRTIRHVISAQTANTMVDLLEKAATGGEAKFFVLKNYRVAGKTGTAQIPVNGQYLPDKTNASFVGFMSGSKKFSMIVRLEQPQTSIYAAETAVPLWMDLANELIKFYGLPPDLNQ